MSKIDIPDPAQHYLVCSTEAYGKRSAKQSLTDNADFILLKKNATPNSTN